MTKALKPDIDLNTGKNKGFISQAVGSFNAQNHDGTFGLQVADAALTHPELRHNNFFSVDLDAVSGTYLENVKFRPRALMRCSLRLRNAGTGAFNATTATLSLVNGTGGKAAGDCFVFTFLNNGPRNDNLTGLLFWAKRSASAGTSKVRAALLDVTALCPVDPVTNAPNTAFLTTPGSGINLDAFTIDADNYYTAAVAYSEITFDSISTATNGAPLYINLNYNSKEARSTVLLKNHVYAIVLYLVRGGAETGLVTLYGAANAALTSDVSFYRGAAGWSGSLAFDTTVKIPFHKIFMTQDAVIDQIHVYAASPNNLAGTILESVTVEENEDLPMDNIPNAAGQAIHREIIGRLNLANERRHSIMLEGKAVIPRGHCICMFILPGYTGKMFVEFNYWINPSGDNSKLKS